MLACLPSTPFWLLGGFVWAKHSLPCAPFPPFPPGVPLIVNASPAPLVHLLLLVLVPLPLKPRRAAHRLAIGLNAAGCWLGAAVCFGLARLLKRCGGRCKCCTDRCGGGGGGGDPTVLGTLSKMMQDNQVHATQDLSTASSGGRGSGSCG